MSVPWFILSGLVCKDRDLVPFYFEVLMGMDKSKLEIQPNRIVLKHIDPFMKLGAKTN